MPPLPPPSVLILAQNPQAAQPWAFWLVDAGACVWQAAADVPPDAAIDVVLTDLPDIQGVAAAAGPAIRELDGQSRPRGVGLLAIGPADWADANLAADFTPRELVLACRLLAEVSRLRFQRAQFAQAQDETERLANTDPLTGLANRRGWDVQLRSKSLAGQSSDHRLWLAIVDLDDFKGVNDAAGLTVGDDTLRRVAGAMAGALRRDDAIARLGGDEFGVLLSGVDQQGAGRVFDRLCAAVAGVAPPPGVGRLTISIGFAGADSSVAVDESLRKCLFAAAEQALRAAKRAGGNRAMIAHVTSC